MKTFRVVSFLIAAATVLLLAGFSFLANLNNPNILSFLTIFLWGCLPFVSLSALILFLLSFFRIDESEDGRLVYNPAHFPWNLLKKMFGIGQANSFCKLNLFIAVLLLVGLAVVLVVFLVFFVLWNFADIEWAKMQDPALFFFLPLALTAFALPMRDKYRKTVARTIFSCAACLGGFYLLVIFPIGFMMTHQFTFFSALVEYVQVVVVSIGVAAVTIAVMYFCLEILPLLVSKEHIARRMYTAFKEKFCPELIERT